MQTLLTMGWLQGIMGGRGGGTTATALPQMFAQDKQFTECHFNSLYNFYPTFLRRLEQQAKVQFGSHKPTVRQARLRECNWSSTTQQSNCDGVRIQTQASKVVLVGPVKVLPSLLGHDTRQQVYLSLDSVSLLGSGARL